MPKLRKVTHLPLSTDQIKVVARHQMALYGSAGLSLRAIARQLGVTAPAIYNYFPRLDDLITSLIMDGYNGQADALEAAASVAVSRPVAERLFAVLVAYRTWALAHPTEYTLLYGNPIPGYAAPAERTMPAARRVFAVVLALLAEAHETGALKPSTHVLSLPPGLRVGLPAIGEASEGLPAPVVHIGVIGMYRLHGMISLEMFGQTSNFVNDGDLFYAHEVRALLAEHGMTVPALSRDAS